LEDQRVLRKSVMLCLALAVVLPASASVLQAKAGLVILVRHAEKSSGSQDPDLTGAGRERAEALAQALENTRLTAIITTQYQRTGLTAAPLAKQRSLVPRVVASTGDVQTHAAAIAAALDDLPDGSSALVVGHSNTIGPIIAALGGPRVPDLCDTEHATIYVLHRIGPAPGGISLLKTRYGAPDPPPAGDCATGR
jgi:broad specificity phosphatase PhoE